MKKLEIKVTRRSRLKLRRGDKGVTVRTIVELEKVAHQAWDLALQKRDAAREKEIVEIFGREAL